MISDCLFHVIDFNLIYFFRVEFTVGNKAVNKFRMIERHFFRDKMLKTFDFEFGYCIPNSRNSCEHIYEFPSLGPDLGNYILSNLSYILNGYCHMNLRGANLNHNHI